MADDEDNIMEGNNSSKEKKPVHRQAKSHPRRAARHEAHGAAAKAPKEHFNWWVVAATVFFLAALLFLILYLAKGTGAGGASAKDLGSSGIQAEATDFINNYLVQPGTVVSVDSVQEVSGVYLLTISLQGQKVTSYMSKDGKIFFPGAYVVDTIKASAANQTQQASQPANVPKTDKPVVEVFVMSYCPFGTQIEKGLLPVENLLGSNIDLQVKFVDYVMHGQKESDENVMQYCIQQDYPAQYYKYLQCFLNASDSPGCRASLGFDEAKLAACFNITDTQFGISADYADKSTWRGSFPRFAIYEADNQKYNVQGSPTLVINGVQVNSARDSESLKTAICNAFSTKPAECGTTLATASPSAGFGYGTSSADTAAAGCGV